MKTLMVQGSMSSAGKSLLVTALCRIYARRGLRVAPFKAQNMSNNAGVCADGGEIGRAQYTQALACGLNPTTDMNPVLLKPEADARSQVIVNGRPWETLAARDYYTRKAHLWEQVTAALDRLRNTYDLVVIEGAGSPVELNLKKGDIVNMRVAAYADAPVLLVGDIDRGGIFAQLLGTLWLLAPEERARVRGLVVNKFRGDPTLFTEGVRMLQERGGVPVLGVVPYLKAHHIPEEDAVAIEDPDRQMLPGQIDIAVIRLPRIANFDDFDPLTREPNAHVRYVDRADDLGEPDAVIIPGTKSTIADLLWMRHLGLDIAVRKYAKTGRPVVGICGGYQMLGRVIRDPQHAESSLDAVDGLNLLPLETNFSPVKATFQTTARITQNLPGWWASVAGEPLSGYEIHMGETQVEMAPLELISRGEQSLDPKLPDGACSNDGQVWGCYLHGLFENDGFRRAWLRSLGTADSTAPLPTLEKAFNKLADHVEAALDMPSLDAMIGL